MVLLLSFTVPFMVARCSPVKEIYSSVENLQFEMMIEGGKQFADAAKEDAKAIFVNGKLVNLVKESTVPLTKGVLEHFLCSISKFSSLL